MLIGWTKFWFLLPKISYKIVFRNLDLNQKWLWRIGPNNLDVTRSENVKFKSFQFKNKIWFSLYAYILYWSLIAVSLSAYFQKNKNTHTQNQIYTATLGTSICVSLTNHNQVCHFELNSRWLYLCCACPKSACWMKWNEAQQKGVWYYSIPASQTVSRFLVILSRTLQYQTILRHCYMAKCIVTQAQAHFMIH